MRRSRDRVRSSGKTVTVPSEARYNRVESQSEEHYMWSDKETRDDCLGFSSYVASLAEVCLEKDIAPLVLGVFGSWGSGKSSLMSMLKDAIDQESTVNKRRVKTLWFNAWRYEGKEEIQPALIQ